MINLETQTNRNLSALGLVMILFLLSILGCKETPRPPSWIKTKVLADREDHPSKILSDGSFVYYVTGGTVASQRAGTNNIKRISLKDGGVSVLVNMGERIPDTTLALDDKFLYWTDGGSILRVPKEGGQSETVVANTGAPAEMIVDDENIYWIIWTGEGSPPKPLMFASKQVGSEAKQLAPPQIGANGLCIDNDTVYWASPAGLKKAPKTGGEATIFYNDPTLNQPTTGLVQDAENFYYAQMDKKGNSSLMKLAKMGGAPRQIAPSINHTMEFVADELYVYYFDDEKGYGSFGPVALRKVSKQGGEPVTLDMGDAGWVKFIAVDKTQVYFTDISKVYALAK